MRWRSWRDRQIDENQMPRKFISSVTDQYVLGRATSLTRPSVDELGKSSEAFGRPCIWPSLLYGEGCRAAPALSRVSTRCSRSGTGRDSVGLNSRPGSDCRCWRFRFFVFGYASRSCGFHKQSTEASHSIPARLHNVHGLSLSHYNKELAVCQSNSITTNLIL
jgi:hypothetical protein